GTIVGTPYYMSPEQIHGQDLDGRSDVYALGAIMYECVVGKPPFEAPNPVGVLSKHLSEEPLRPSARSPLSVPAEADEIILRCLEKDPDNRYQTAEEVRQALIEYLTTVGSHDWRLSGVGQASFAWVVDLALPVGGRGCRHVAARDAWPVGERTQPHPERRHASS
ncbi:MAG: protein kinase, partial [Deltaproteobacteria bacterium]|nr:protein kinase [Deltaproteobacteria bacterium]